jgi:hypothetical protein
MHSFYSLICEILHTGRGGLSRDLSKSNLSSLELYKQIRYDSSCWNVIKTQPQLTVNLTAGFQYCLVLHPWSFSNEIPVLTGGEELRKP